VALDPELRRAAAKRMRQAATVSAQFGGPSKLERLAHSEAGRAWLRELSPIDAHRLLYSWEVNARPKQLLPMTPWEIAIVCAGRGFGKTRMAAEHVRAEIFSGRAKSVLMLGPTERETLRIMVGGRKRGGSGLLDVLSPWERKRVRLLDEKKELRISFDDGSGDATIYLCSGEDRDLRGGGYDLAWLDELVKVGRASELIDNVLLSLREGPAPKLLLTTTPKASADWLRELLVDPKTIVRRGSTDENRALSAAAVERMRRRFAGSLLAEQEMHGDLLDDQPGTLFRQSLIDDSRVAAAPPLSYVAIGLDPSKSGHADSDECGIVVVGRTHDREYYVLADGTQRSDPIAWVATLAELWRAHRANVLIVETNNLGRHALSSILAYWGNGSKPYTQEVHAVGDKLSRAEPLSVLYEQGRVHHVGVLAALEDELVSFAPGGKSPNRIDALGHAIQYFEGRT
jgi:predicted phage terminase large subunit-like protein